MIPVNTVIIVKESPPIKLHGTIETKADGQGHRLLLEEHGRVDIGINRSVHHVARDMDRSI